MERIRILVVDEPALFRDGLRALLEDQEDLQWVGETGDADMALELAKQLEPDVILMELNLPGHGGVEAARKVHWTLPHAKVIVLTMCNDVDMIAAAIQAGVAGYVLKEVRAAELLQVIRTVAAGAVTVYVVVAPQILHEARHLGAREAEVSVDRLTERELDILQLLGEGYGNGEIADSLSLSPQTIKNRLSRIYQKLGVKNRTGAVMEGLRRGVVRPRN